MDKTTCCITVQIGAYIYPTVAGVGERNPIVKYGAEERNHLKHGCVCQGTKERVQSSVTTISDTFGSWFTLVRVDQVLVCNMFMAR